MASMLFFNALASSGQQKPGPQSCPRHQQKGSLCERELGWIFLKKIPKVFFWDGCPLSI